MGILHAERHWLQETIIIWYIENNTYRCKSSTWWEWAIRSDVSNVCRYDVVDMWSDKNKKRAAATAAAHGDITKCVFFNCVVSAYNIGNYCTSFVRKILPTLNDIHVLLTFEKCCHHQFLEWNVYVWNLCVVEDHCFCVLLSCGCAGQWKINCHMSFTKHMHITRLHQLIYFNWHS